MESRRTLDSGEKTRVFNMLPGSHGAIHRIDTPGVEGFMPWQIDFIVSQPGPPPKANFLPVRWVSLGQRARPMGTIAEEPLTTGGAGT